MKAKNVLKKFVVFSLCISMLTGCCFFEDEVDFEEEVTEQTSEISDENTEDSSETEKKDEEEPKESENTETEEKKSEESSDVKEDSEKTPESQSDDKGSDGESAEKKNEEKNPASNWVWAELKENVDPDKVYSAKDDFHMYVNKDWILSHDIPDGYSEYSKFAERQTEADKNFKALLTDETLTSDLARQIQYVYKTYLDWDERNRIGYEPLLEMYKEVEDIDSVQDFYDYIIDNDNFPLFSWNVSPDLENSSKYMFSIIQPGFFLGDVSEYTERTPNGDILYNILLGKLEYMLPRLGKTKEEAKELLDKALAIDELLAKNAYSIEDMYSSDIYDRIINKMTVEEAGALCPDYPVYDILKHIGLDKDEVINVENPDYLKALGSIVKEENLEYIKANYLVELCTYNSGILDEETYRYTQGLINKMFDIGDLMPDEDVACMYVKDLLPIQCQQLYIEVYGSEEEKEYISNTCRQVIDTYSEMLKENDYLSKETIDKAVEKLNAISVHALYPDKWPDVSGCDLYGLSLFDADYAANDFILDYNMAKVGTDVDKDLWIDLDGISILDCNAFYSPQENSINMLLGMMGEPFYSEDKSVESLYATFAATWIGHEISHAFDSNGCLYDKDGNISCWWTEEDKAAFNERIEKVINYMSSIELEEGLNVIGENVNAEIIADITGLQCGLRMASKIENFDYVKFFEIYGSLNTSISNKIMETYAVFSDPHPLPYLRTNISVQQFEEFYKTFDVKEGDGMYLAPEDRLLVW